MLDDEMMMEILPLLRREYDKAVQKHPEFTRIGANAVCIIAEELGELAKEINDGAPGCKQRAIIEAAHVAVTAIRTMEMLQPHCEKTNRLEEQEKK